MTTIVPLRLRIGCAVNCRWRKGASSRCGFAGIASAAIAQYCTACHSAKLKTGGLFLDPAAVSHPATSAEQWEKVIRKLRGQSMPPAGMPRPDSATYAALDGLS